LVVLRNTGLGREALRAADAFRHNGDCRSMTSGLKKHRPMRVAFLAFAAALGLVLATGRGPEARAQQIVGGMVLPAGEVVTGPVYRFNGTFVPSITNGADANAYVNSVPPTQSFVNNAPAIVVRTSVATQYVRFFTAGVTNAVGGFIAPSNAVRGLTPQQVRDVLALPFTPNSMTLVNVPAGTCILYGTAAPITGSFPASPSIPAPGPWGNGGAMQGTLIGVTNDPNCQNPARVPAGNFINQQMIAGYALAYRPSAGVGNTYAVAAALDVGAFPAQFTDMDSVYNALDLLNAGSPLGLQAALKQLGGESYADFGFMRIMSARAFLDVLHQQMRDGRGGRSIRAVPTGTERAEAPLDAAHPTAPASDFTGFGNSAQQMPAAAGHRRSESGGVWFAPYGSVGWLNGDPSTHSTSYGLHGFAAGADLALADSLLAGLSLSYWGTSFATSIPSNSGSNEAISVAAYVSYAPGPWYVDAAAGYAYNWSSLSRTIVFPGVFRVAQGNPAANQFLGSIEGSHGFALGRQMALTPFGRFEVTAATQNGFAETGAGAISLNAAAQTTTSVRSIIGLQVSGSVSALRPQDLWLAARAGWAHDYADVSGTLSASFLGKPDTSFTVVGPSPDRNAATLGASLNLALGSGQAFLNYDANVAQSYAMHTGMVGLRLSF
jgi:uncharacterized protein with beta-barrel porin domain